ncbi:hypothetical protein HYS94_02130 [Candidatus Daviesbacteria bacterium]|nr:hypothetical protein [Candidatus Daviesbacteria bacterium]
MFICQARSKNKFCDKPANWRAEWSDIELFVCDEDRLYVREVYKGDSKLDRTGIFWTSDLGTTEYEDY